MQTSHSYGGSLVLPAANDIVQIMCGESHAKDFWKIPLAGNTGGRRISVIK
jgi:hypothetical protein